MVGSPSAWRGRCRRLRAPLAAALVSAAAALSSPSPAQSLVGDRVPEIVVRASPGPALWRVTKGRSELVILGSVEPTPADRTWNAVRVDEALQGARTLLLSPGSTPGFAWADNFHDWERHLLQEPDGRTLGQELGSDIMGRLSQIAMADGQPLARYSIYRPGPAGMVLLQDSWPARQLTGAAVDAAVVAMAQAKHVKILKVDEGGSLPLIDAMPDMSKAQHLACAEESLERFDWESANVESVYRAWEDGDVGTLRRNYRPLQLCKDSIPGGARRRAQAKAIWIKALEGALNVPGRTVALMDISDLLAPDGILAALQVQGAMVVQPPDESAAPPAPETAAVQLGPDRNVTLYVARQSDLKLARSLPQLLASTIPMVGAVQPDSLISPGATSSALTMCVRGACSRTRPAIPVRSGSRSRRTEILTRYVTFYRTDYRSWMAIE